jgi:glycosyltransferase involved in cell wall biosynthesis
MLVDRRRLPRLEMFSICVPAYETALCIRAVESAQAQTYRSIEVRMVDDASTDGILDRLRTRDNRRIGPYSD